MTLTAVPGVRVGHWTDPVALTGVTERSETYFPALGRHPAAVSRLQQPAHDGAVVNIQLAGRFVHVLAPDLEARNPDTPVSGDVRPARAGHQLTIHGKRDPPALKRNGDTDFVPVPGIDASAGHEQLAAIRTSGESFGGDGDLEQGPGTLPRTFGEPAHASDGVTGFRFRNHELNPRRDSLLSRDRINYLREIYRKA